MLRNPAAGVARSLDSFPQKNKDNSLLSESGYSTDIHNEECTEVRHPDGSSAEHRPSSQGAAGNCCEETSENSENETEANSAADMESLSLSKLYKEDTTSQVDQTIQCRIKSNDIEPQSNTSFPQRKKTILFYLKEAVLLTFIMKNALK